MGYHRGTQGLNVYDVPYPAVTRCGQGQGHSICFNSGLQLATLIKIKTNIPSQNSVVLESSVKPNLGSQFGRPCRLGLAEDLRTTYSGCKFAQKIRNKHCRLRITEDCEPQMYRFWNLLLYKFIQINQLSYYLYILDLFWMNRCFGIPVCF